MSLKNFYLESDRVYVEGNGWTSISDLNAGDRVLNVDMDDDRRGFFAPVISIEKKISSRLMMLPGRLVDLSTEVLLEKNGSPCTTTWGDLYKAYVNNEQWTLSECRPEKQPVWDHLCVYSSCNMDGTSESNYLKENILMILAMYSGLAELKPEDDQGCAVRFRVRRDTIPAATIRDFVTDSGIAFTEERSMIYTTISIYEDEVMAVIVDLINGVEDGCTLWSSEPVNLSQYEKRLLVSMFTSGNTSPLDMGRYIFNSNEEGCIIKGRGRLNQITLCKNEDIDIHTVNNFIIPMAMTSGLTLSSVMVNNGATPHMIFTPFPSWDLYGNDFPRGNNVPYVEEFNVEEYAIRTQTPYVMMKNPTMYVADGALTMIVPVG